VSPAEAEERAVPPRPKIGVRLALAGDPGELLADARALENAGADAIWTHAADGDPYVVLAACAAVTWRIPLIAAGDPQGSGRATCARLSRGRLVVAEELAEPWAHVAFPADRAAWRTTLADASASGAAGVVIANDPRLLDLLRNPDQEIDRADLNIAAG
jgi:luciferase-like monooxygenase